MKNSMAAQQSRTIKADPRIKLFLGLSIMYWIFCALMWAGTLLRILTGVGFTDAQGQFSAGLFFNTFGVPLLWTAIAILYAFVMRFLERNEHKRQAAAQGNPALLATEQPFPDAQALSLPLTVRMRPRWRWFIILASSTITAFLLPIIINFLIAIHAGNNGIGQPMPFDVLFAILSIMLGFIVLVVGIMCIVIYIKGREQITLTEYGIMVVGMTPRMHSVSWSEARLFAIINPQAFKALKDSQPLLLELASEHDMVRWTWLRGISRRMSFVTPALPLEEYELQMQKVLSVIAAKTGLSLYDLRK